MTTELDRDMEEASGRMDNAKKRKLQSRMLEATFEMYFRVLKNAASDSPARGIPLMTPALVGLGKFTHLISVNFMADLMEVFRRLLAGGALGVDQKARCLLTACEILSGHGEALQVDAGEFHRQLYAMLAQPSGGSRGWGSERRRRQRPRRGRGRRSRHPSRARPAKILGGIQTGGPGSRRRLRQETRGRGDDVRGW